MQEQLPTTARMQEIGQCRSNCRERQRNPSNKRLVASKRFEGLFFEPDQIRYPIGVIGDGCRNLVETRRKPGLAQSALIQVPLPAIRVTQEHSSKWGITPFNPAPHPHCDR
jgi:hypothetical protein